MRTEMPREPSPVQAGGGAGPSAAREPRVWEPSRVRAVSQGPVRAAECGPAGPASRRDGGHAGATGGTDGIGETRAGEGGLGQSDPRGAEFVFGEQPFDWGAGGSAVVPGSCGGLVRAAANRRSAAAARAGQASHRLSAYY